MKAPVIAKLAEALAGPDMRKRHEAAGQPYGLLAERRDLSAAVPILVGRVLEIDVDTTLMSAAEWNLDVLAAIPALTRRLEPPRSPPALAALIAHRVHENNVGEATALFRNYGGDAYVCQEIGQRVRPSRVSADVAVLGLGLVHADPHCRYYAALGLQQYGEAGLDIVGSPAPWMTLQNSAWANYGSYVG